jgi:hypothetical protein
MRSQLRSLSGRYWKATQVFASVVAVSEEIEAIARQT